MIASAALTFEHRVVQDFNNNRQPQINDTMSSDNTRGSSGQANEEPATFSDSFNRLNIAEAGGDGENRVGPDGEPAPRTEEEYARSQLTLRAIVSSKEAGVIIGKAGKNVADLRDETGVKAGVSKVVQGVHDRVLTVTGGLEGLAKAYAIVARGLLEGAPMMGMGGVISTNGTHRKLILVHHRSRRACQCMLMRSHGQPCAS